MSEAEDVVQEALLRYHHDVDAGVEIRSLINPDKRLSAPSLTCTSSSANAASRK